MKCTTPTILNENSPLTTAVIRMKAIRMRRSNGCLDSIGALRQAITDPVNGVQQRRGEGFVEHLA